MADKKTLDSPPHGLRAAVLQQGDEQLLVLSYPILPVDFGATLTVAEAEVARFAVEGLSNQQIATARGTAVRTVANQMASILAKLDCGSRRELAVRCVRGEIGAATGD